MASASTVKEFMRKTNMPVSEARRWMRTEAFKQYKRESSGKPDKALERYIRVKKNPTKASESDVRKINSFIDRMSKVEAGPRKFGSGRDKVSARTAALRSWGRDPTQRFT